VGSCWLTHSWERRDRKWTLAWEGQFLTLTDPDGRAVFERVPASRVVNLYALDDERSIKFVVGYELLESRRRNSALAALRTAVEVAVAEDAAFRAERTRTARESVRHGFVAGAVAGGLFGLYVWWAFTGDDPLPGTWLRWVFDWFGWLIGWMLIVLLAFAVAGPTICYSGLRELRRIRRVERRMTADPYHDLTARESQP
jgi:hypothetical protein